VISLVTFLAMVAASAPAPAGSDPARELSNRQLAGQRIVTGFPGERPPGVLVRMIREGRVAGVVLFASNFGTEAEARDLIGRLRRIRQPRGLRQPLLVAVDQEGGLVKRLPGPPTKSAAEIGAAGRSAAARQGKETGRYLDRLGFNVDLAPVLDLAVPGGEIADTARGFAPTPDGVIGTGLAFARGLERGGVAATAKHFPGFGRARANTDDASQTIPTARKRLRSRDERPFRAFADEKGALVMLANAVYPALDERRPAGLSRRIASHELRRVAGFDGVSITDSLDAAAITQLGSPATVAELAAGAGTDLLLFTDLASAAEGAEALARDLRAGRLDRRRFRTSVGRVIDLRGSLRG